jgi:hypothetical protein
MAAASAKPRAPHSDEAAPRPSGAPEVFGGGAMRHWKIAATHVHSAAKSV